MLSPSAVPVGFLTSEYGTTSVTPFLTVASEDSEAFNVVVDPSVTASGTT